MWGSAYLDWLQPRPEPRVGPPPSRRRDRPPPHPEAAGPAPGRPPQIGHLGEPGNQRHRATVGCPGHVARPEIRLKESTNMPLALPGERRLIVQVAARAGG